MILIVGLGNPGKKFEKTRHNLGFQVVDKLKKEFGFFNWKKEKRYKAKISEGKIAGKKILLSKPQTFMNESGKSAKALINNYQLTINNLWVVHDDIDLPLGKIRIVKNRGAAGHKGVQSIIDEIGTRDFIRFRIGIKPNKKVNSKQSIVNSKFNNFVLKNFTKKEERIIKKAIKKTCEAIELAIKRGLEKAMSEYN